jgi:hypothetical protein
MNRLIEYTVFCGLVIAWRLAGAPTSRSPLGVNATTDGVVRLPSMFAMTMGSPPSMTDTTELVVPRSMPMILDMRVYRVLWVGPRVPGEGSGSGPLLEPILFAKTTTVPLVTTDNTGSGIGLGLTKTWVSGPFRPFWQTAPRISLPA